MREGPGEVTRTRADPAPRVAARFQRATFALVVPASAIAGIALFASPGSTERYFSWGLSPAPAAALAGGFYLASAITFGLAVQGTWREGRGLVPASLAFVVPALAATLIHLEAFDLGRPQAVAWVVLFSAAPLPFLALLVAHARRPSEAGSRPAAWRRAVLLLVGGGLALAGALLWIDPVGSGAWLPFSPPPLSGRFLASTAGFAAVLSLWAATRPIVDWPIPTVGVVTFLLGGVAAAVRTLGDLDGGAVYLAVLSGAAVAVAAAALPALRATRRRDGP